VRKLSENGPTKDNLWLTLCCPFLPGIDFFRYKITFQTTGTHFQGESGAVNFGFYLYKVRFPGAPGAVFGVANFIAG
jgi:hypothetical protein